MAKSLLKNYDSFETIDGVMKWLSERGITPCWNSEKRNAYFSKDTPKTATRQFIQVLGIDSEERVQELRIQLKARPDWQKYVEKPRPAHNIVRHPSGFPPRCQSVRD